jgi:hypothetical protein
MSLRQIWNEEQRSRLIAQLTVTSRAFAAALPAEDAVDGLIINLHLCLTLELSPAEVQRIFSPRVVTFLAGMLAAAHSENTRPQQGIDLSLPLPNGHSPVQTQIGRIDGDGKLRPIAAYPAARGQGTVHVVFRGRTNGPAA